MPRRALEGVEGDARVGNGKTCCEGRGEEDETPMRKMFCKIQLQSPYERCGDEWGGERRGGEVLVERERGRGRDK